MRNMGGLGRRMKWTSVTFAVGWLALAGVFPFAGFWSKDEILVDSWTHDRFVWILLTLAAFLTAVYMTRLMILVFDGTPRSAAAARTRESSALIVAPLVILALLSLIGGALNLPGVHSLAGFIGHHVADFHLGIAITSTGVALLGIFAAWAVYSRGRIDAFAPDRLALLPFGLFSHLNRKWYWDEGYALIFVKPYYWLADKLAFDVDWHFWHDFAHDAVLAEPFKTTAAFLANPIDLGVVDGIANGLARAIRNGSAELRKVQTGYVRNYALSIVLGVAAIIAGCVLR
jgi:NADH-quinone oxidoreductase subunit L